MTQTLTRTDQWLADFGAALEQGDVDRAAGHVRRAELLA